MELFVKDNNLVKNVTNINDNSKQSLFEYDLLQGAILILSLSVEIEDHLQKAS